MLNEQNREGNGLGDEQYTGCRFQDPAALFPESEHKEDKQDSYSKPEQSIQRIDQGVGGPVDRSAVQGPIVDDQEITLQPEQEGKRIDCGAESDRKFRR